MAYEHEHRQNGFYNPAPAPATLAGYTYCDKSTLIRLVLYGAYSINGVKW